MKVDLTYNAEGRLPLDFGYQLFSSVSKYLPEIHGVGDVGIFVMGLQRAADHFILKNSKVAIRCDSNMLYKVNLAGRTLNVGQQVVHLGVASIYPLVPKPKLTAHKVFIRLRDCPKDITQERFLQSAQLQLMDMNVSAGVKILSEPVFRRICVKDRKLICFGMELDGLSDIDSLRIQSDGIGGKRSMGCGIFL